MVGRVVRSPEPVLPDYSGAGLAGLVPALASPPGDRPGWLPALLGNAAQVVLLVVDGLGWLQLLDNQAQLPTVSGLQGGPITSVVPTTTATALTSIVVGAPPAAHGVVGYRVVVGGPTGPEVLNVLRWRTSSGDAKPFVDPRRFQRLPAFAGRPVPVVSKSDFNGTGFSLAHQRDAPLAAWSVASSLAVEVRRLLGQGEPLVYAYYDGVDKVAHARGFGEHYQAELIALDRIVADVLDVLPSGAALALTADHGQVEVGPRALPVVASVMAEVGMVSGEARFRWLHARPGRSAPLMEAAAARYGLEAWVRTREEVEADGWFGGPLDEELRSRLGDVALVPFEPVGYLDPADTGDAKLVCRHGSLTPAEMLVPLVAGAG